MDRKDEQELVAIQELNSINSKNQLNSNTVSVKVEPDCCDMFIPDNLVQNNAESIEALTRITEPYFAETNIKVENHSNEGDYDYVLPDGECSYNKNSIQDKNKEPDLEMDTFKCMHCLMTFSGEDFYNEHMRRVHKITIQQLNSINSRKNQLNSNIVSVKVEPYHSDMYSDDNVVENNTEPNETITSVVKPYIVKTEKNDSIEVTDIKVENHNDEGDNDYVLPDGESSYNATCIQDQIKEGIPKMYTFKCMHCLMTFSGEDFYNEHMMTVHKVMAKKLTYEEMERLLEDDQRSDLEDEDSDLDFEVLNSEDAEVEDMIELESDDELAKKEENLGNWNSYFGGNKNITFTSKPGLAWSSNPPGNISTRADNIVSSSTGLREEARDIKSIKDAFNLYITSDMLEKITTHTNQFCQRKSNSAQISKSELEAFIGVLFASGRCNGRRLALNKIWTTNQLFKFYFFSVAMSRDKFTYIYSNLRFDDINTRELRINITGDKFEPIRSIYNDFNAACLKYFSPGFYITVDERLATFKGKCPFRVCMKSKPGRYGIKIWVAADVNTAYILNSQPYTGKNLIRKEVNQRERVVTDLVRPFYGSGRGVTTNNFFTSIPLANTLFYNNITLTGTMRKNKREIPKEFVNSGNREEFSTLFGYSDNLTLISYIPKKNTPVILLSTECHNSEVEEGPKKRPSLILHYNRTKGGVNTGVKMTHEYSCVRTTRRWPFRIFMELIDMAALNAYIIWTHKYPEWRKNDRRRRQHFMKDLAMELVKENVLHRKNSGKHFHRHIQHGFDLYDRAMNGEIVTPTTLPIVAQDLARSRCSFCPRNQDRKTRIHCNFCKKTICLLHRTQSKIVICPDCKQEHDGCDLKIVL